MPLAFHPRFRTPFRGLLAAIWVCAATHVFAQLPYIGTGPDSMMSQIDFAEMTLDRQSQRLSESDKQKAQNRELIDSGVVSAFDLQAPNNAIEQFNRASALLKAQKSKEAVKYLQKAIEDYPKFASAYMALGRAYIDQEDVKDARTEFEAAAKVDDKFALPLVNLGRLALSLNDFPTAQSELEKAAALRPKDAKILATLAFAENGNHQYLETIKTVQQVHALDHQGMANIHYIAASAAMSIKDYVVMEGELNTFLAEDPTNEYAASARKTLAILEHNRTVIAANAGSAPGPNAMASPTTVTFPNSDRLKEELNGLGKESDCDNCRPVAEASPATAGVPRTGASAPPPAASGMYLIRKSVDDVAIFFSVSSHGHMIDDLQESEIQIRDNNKPPARLLQFAPQSKLPLRLALLIDTSGSVHDRFSFEKNAAAKFVDKVLNHTTDLAFVAGFSSETTVTRDFSGDPQDLGAAIQKLSNGGGTALFDAVAFACRKLADYPDDERVARVLVILSDGEDNSSHRSLKQSIEAAERGGVTIYTVSTREDRGDKTDADRVLETLAERSGGEAMFPGDVLTLGRSFDKLRDLIHSRYFIAYKPADFVPDGRYRAIRIVAEKNGKRLQVRARKGYHARLEGGSQ